MSIQGQTIVKLKKADGIYLIPCKINGVDFELYFDTGASLVSLSLKEANVLITQGKLKASDIIGKTRMTIANGQFANGTIVLLHEIKINDFVLHDIEAVITESQTAPLLLGQSAISKFGEFSFDYKTETLTIKNIANQKVASNALKLRDEYKKITSPQEVSRYNDFYKHRNEIIKNLTLEIVNFEIFEIGGDTKVNVPLDITNNTDYDFIYIAQLKSQPMKRIDIVVTIFTEGGKIFTETLPFVNTDLPARNTNSSFRAQVNIRSNKLTGVKIRVKDSEL
jgi:clan AA aspartic protease (TIGR02281 family)